MTRPPPRALLHSISRWFQRDPVVAVGAFGKSGVVNGHQEVAGDATSGMVETARILYYDGALPNCARWEADLAGQDRVLSKYVLRWAGGRGFFCVVSPVAEGGATEAAFAPFVSCVEMDSTFGLDLVATSIAGLEEAQPSLLASPPARWPEILAPLRATLSKAVGDFGQRTPEERHRQLLSALQMGLSPLGNQLVPWLGSLAEELKLPLTLPGSPPPRGGPTVVSRFADAPRLTSDALADGKTWSALLESVGFGHVERWLICDPNVHSVRIFVGRPRDRDFSVLWRSTDAAGEHPTPIAGSRSNMLRAPLTAWLHGAGLWNEAVACAVGEAQHGSIGGGSPSPDAPSPPAQDD